MVAHPVVLRGLALEGTDAQPTILARSDQDFVNAVLGELEHDAGLNALKQSVMTGMTSRPLKLYQPVHRTFHLVLLELVCDLFQEPQLRALGEPRLDPQQIESAGLVVRRLNGSRREAWLQETGAFQGWVKLNDEQQDPDPVLRRPDLTTGIAELDSRLGIGRLAMSRATESVSPLFPAPPEVCCAAGKTLLYGLVPVTSDEFSELADRESQTPPALTPVELGAIFAPILTHSGANRDVEPAFGRQIPLRIVGNRLQLDFQNVDKRFISTLRWVIELGGLEQTDAATALLDALNAEEMVVDPAGRTPAPNGAFRRFRLDDPPELVPRYRYTVRPGDFIRQAATHLRDSDEDPSAGSAPAATGIRILWDFSAPTSNAVLEAMRTLLAERGRQLKLVQGRKRFDTPDAQYQLRAFVRVQRQDGCPPELVWSEYSRPYVIAPWHEPNDAVPPIQISLPDVSSRAALKSLKPNVAFVMPEGLYDLINQSADDFLDKAVRKSDDSGAIEWICSFSIPIITLCAFIVLNIFLSLLNIVFNWLMFIKICLPFKKP